MRRFGYVVFLVLVLACGKDTEDFKDTVITSEEGGPNTPDDSDPNDGGDNSGTNQNTAPEVASLVFPLNETECSNSDLTFQWNTSIDADGDTISYNLILDTSPNFNEDPTTYGAISETSYTLNLPPSTALYWKIESSDSKETVTSETWSLYTQGEGQSNSIPQLEYLFPESNAIISNPSPQLQWQAFDIETSEENLIYKVYFSEVGKDLILVDDNNGISNYQLSELNFDTSYQWVIYVSDTDGATNVGEVFTFMVQQD